MSLANRLTPFFLVALIFMASMVQASAPAAYPKNIGLLLFPSIGDPAAIKIPVYNEPKDDVEQIGEFQIRLEDGNPNHSYIVIQQTVENPDAGLFDNKMKIMEEAKPLREYISPSNVFAPLIIEDRGAWLKLEHGWIKRKDAETAGATPLTWEQVVANPLYPEFTISDNPETYVQGGKVEEVRKSALYVALTDLPVYKSADSSSVTLATIQQPLRMAIMDMQGNWIKVFVVLGRCDSAGGKTDYREGISGWIKRSDEHKMPTIIASPEAC